MKMKYQNSFNTSRILTSTVWVQQLKKKFKKILKFAFQVCICEVPPSWGRPVKPTNK